MRLNSVARDPSVSLRALYVSLSAVATIACGDAEPAPSAPAAPPASAPLVEPPAPPATETEPAPERRRPRRATTPAERASRVAELDAAERAAIRARLGHLRQGRQLARAGDHEGALREFRAVLESAPTDATALCEAGFQAFHLERFDDARALLERGAERSGNPSTSGACLYNLGRVYEARGDRAAAAEAYRRSLAVRPNDVVSRRLAGLADAPAADAQPAPATEGAEWFPTLEALCESMTPDVEEAYCDGSMNWEPGFATPGLQSVGFVEVSNPDERMTTGWVVQRGERGVRAVGEVTSSDETDSFGRLEVSETVEEVLFEDGAVIVLVTGSVDEREGEAEAYFTCEEAGGDVTACYEAALEDLPEPATWTTRHRFLMRDGLLTPAP